MRGPRARRGWWPVTTSWSTLAPRVAKATVRIHPAAAGYGHEEPGGPDAEGATGQAFGSGFFAAPGWVLTCAHVLMREEAGTGMRLSDLTHRKVGLTFDGHTAVGAVECTLYEPSTGVDIALIRLLDPVPHACLSLAGEIGAHRDPLAYFGYARETGPLKPINGRCTMDGTVGDGDERQIRLGGVSIPRGVSGGPVLNLATAEVVGVVTHQVADDQGGLAASLSQLHRLFAEGSGELYHRLWRAHDRAHHDHHYYAAGDRHDPRGVPSWTRIRTDLAVEADAGEARRGPPPPGALSPARRTRMYGLLAEMLAPDCPSTVVDVVDAAGCGENWYELELPPRTWRDGAALALRVEPARELDAALLYCAAVVERDASEDPEPREALGRWVHETVRDEAAADRLRRPMEALRRWGADQRSAGVRPHGPGTATPGVPADAARVGQRGVVRLELYEHPYREAHGRDRTPRYGWALHASRCGAESDTHTEFDEAGVGAVRDQLAGQLAGPLSRAFAWCDRSEQPAALEAVLPLGLFDLPLDRWPGEDGTPLGALRPVTVRWLDRGDPLRDVALRREHEDRWLGLQRGPLRLYPLHDDTGRLRTTLSRGWLTEGSRKAVPALYCPAEDDDSRQVLLSVLDAGYGVALWRRRMDWQYDWREFARNVKRVLSGIRAPSALPAELHRLRALAQAPDPDALWAKDLAVLYDPPEVGDPGEDRYLWEPQ